jgi:IS5 family transposase
MYFTQTWRSMSDEVLENAIYDSSARSAFFRRDRVDESAPDATTLLKSRRMLETDGLIQPMVVVTKTMPPIRTC